MIPENFDVLHTGVHDLLGNLSSIVEKYKHQLTAEQLNQLYITVKDWKDRNFGNSYVQDIIDKDNESSALPPR